jgi:hypothetical protein
MESVRRVSLGEVLEPLLEGETLEPLPEGEEVCIGRNHYLNKKFGQLSVMAIFFYFYTSCCQCCTKQSSGSGSRKYGSGSFPFLIIVLSGLK